MMKRWITAPSEAFRGHHGVCGASLYIVEGQNLVEPRLQLLGQDGRRDSPSSLEKRIELLLGVARRGRTLGAQDRIRAIIVAVVGNLLVANPFRLRLGALVVLGRIVEVAVAAGVQVCNASRAGVAGGDPRPGWQINDVCAFPARELHKTVKPDERRMTGDKSRSIDLQLVARHSPLNVTALAQLHLHPPVQQ
jgi:hypothetical protein